MKEIILININGLDQPGVTSSITSILAEYKSQVLDMGQAVIHDNLSLGIVAEFEQQENASQALKDILFRTHELGMQVKFTPISESSYQQWTSERGRPRHIITLLARKVTAEHIARVTHIIAKYGLNIDRVDRLSGRVSLGEAQANNKACVEFSARGPISDKALVRQDFLALSSELDVDIAFQDDNDFRRHRRVVCFDMDSTLIEAEVIDELAKAAGVGAQVIAITEAAMRGEIDFSESFRQRVALLKGLDESVLSGIAESLPITEGAQNLVSRIKSMGYKTAILSGGFTYFGRYLQEKLGIDYVYANELEIENGKVTGNVKGQIVDGQRKADLLREIAESEQISLEQVIAVGDGANDLPMLSIAGLGIAFRAKPIVQESAKQAISTLGLDGILYLLGFRDEN